MSRELQALDAIRQRLLQISQANGFGHDLNGAVAVVGVDTYDPLEDPESIRILPSATDALSSRKNASAERAVEAEREVIIEWAYQGDPATFFASGLPRVRDLKKAVLTRSSARDYVAAGATISFAGSEVGIPTSGGKHAIARITVTLNTIEPF